MSIRKVIAKIEQVTLPWLRFTARFTVLSVASAVFGLVLSTIVSTVVSIFNVEAGKVLDIPTLYSIAFVVAYLGLIQRRDSIRLESKIDKLLDRNSSSDQTHK